MTSRQIWTIAFLVVATHEAPCSAQAARIYVGGVTNDSLRFQPGPLTIGIVESPGQALRGYFNIGVPLGGSGPFAGWRRADTLFAVTTSSTGDTIGWLSTSSGQFIGGTYRITGGPYRGQTGVWSASQILAVTLNDSLNRVPVEVVVNAGLKCPVFAG